MEDSVTRGVKARFLEEKASLLGELSGRMKQTSPEGKYYGESRDEDTMDESFPPPPPVFQTYAAQLSGKDEEDDLPPPPPPSQGGNFLSTMTPRPFITPSPYQSPAPPPSPPPIQTVNTSFQFQARPSSFSPVNSSKIRTPAFPTSVQSFTPPPQTPVNEPAFNKDVSVKHVSYQTYPSSSSSSNSTPIHADSSTKKPPTPWLSNNSAGVSPSFRSISSSSLSSNDSPTRKDSNWSISPEHATRKVLGGLSCQPDPVDRKDSFDSSGLLKELNRIKRQCFGCSGEVESGGCTAVGKTYHKECFKCSNCKTVLQAKFFTEGDKPMCEYCYKELTCPLCCLCGKLVDGDGVKMKGEEKVYHTHCLTCSYCTNTIEGKFFTIDGQVVCGACARGGQVEEKNCDVCKGDIAGDCLISNGKNFHSACMKCAVCGDNLTDTYFTFMDKLICEKDYKETQTICSECGEAISGSYYTLDNEKVVCEKDYKKSLGNCGRCGKIVEGKILKVSGGFFHPDCFTCEVCKKSLVGVPFSLDEGKQLYCSEDYARKHASVCSVCREHILPKKGETSAPRLRALGRDFHPECFKCEDCTLLLDSRVSGAECYPVANRPYCAQCSKNRQA